MLAKVDILYSSSCLRSTPKSVLAGSIKGFQSVFYCFANASIETSLIPVSYSTATSYAYGFGGTVEHFSHCYCSYALDLPIQEYLRTL